MYSESAGVTIQYLARLSRSKSWKDKSTMQKYNIPSKDVRPPKVDDLRMMTDENDRLLANTHVLQETIETLLMGKAAQNESEIGPNSQLADVAVELESMVVHLHNTQESLEEVLRSNVELTAQLDQKNLRIKNLLARLPGQWEADSFDIKLQKNQNEGALHWYFTNVYIGNICYSELEFETKLDGENVSLTLIKDLVLHRLEDTITSLNRPNARRNSIRIAPIAGNAYEGSNATISQLDTSTWTMIVDLIQSLTDYSSSRPANAPKLISRATFLRGLRNLHGSLKSWAPIVRYDNFDAVEELSRPYYAGLSITFENLSQSHRNWSSFKFTFATVDTVEGAFGTNPRIEFPEHGASHAMSSWYAESDDNEGRRLELRFDNPNNMDMKVWRSLNEEDQLLVAGILIRLPNILAHNEERFTTGKYSRTQWIDLIQLVRANLTKNLV
jgi:hypothetical protein